MVKQLESEGTYKVPGRGEIILVETKTDVKVSDIVCVSGRVLEVVGVEMAGSEARLGLQVIPAPEVYEWLNWLQGLPKWLWLIASRPFRSDRQRWF